MSQLSELLQWLLYNCIIPLLSVVLVWLVASLSENDGKNRGLFSIVSDGQLYFYCTVISAAAIGDFVTSCSKTNLSTSIYFGVIILSMIFSTFLYGVTIAWGETEQKNLSNNKKLAWISILIAILTTILVAGFRFSLELL